MFLMLQFSSHAFPSGPERHWARNASVCWYGNNKYNNPPPPQMTAIKNITSDDLISQYDRSIRHGEIFLFSRRTHRDILLSQPEIRLYLPFSDWFGTRNRRPFGVQNQSTIWYQFELIWHQKNVPVYCKDYSREISPAGVLRPTVP